MQGDRPDLPGRHHDRPRVHRDGGSAVPTTDAADGRAGSSPAADVRASAVGPGRDDLRSRPRARRPTGSAGGARWGPAPIPTSPRSGSSVRSRSTGAATRSRWLLASGRCWRGSPSTPGGRSPSTGSWTTCGGTLRRPAPATRSRCTSPTSAPGSAPGPSRRWAAATASSWQRSGSTRSCSNGSSRWRWASAARAGRGRDRLARRGRWPCGAATRLADLQDYAFARVEAARLAELRATALEHLAEALLDAGQLDRLTDELAPPGARAPLPRTTEGGGDDGSLPTGPRRRRARPLRRGGRPAPRGARPRARPDPQGAAARDPHRRTLAEHLDRRPPHGRADPPGDGTRLAGVAREPARGRLQRRRAGPPGPAAVDLRRPPRPDRPHRRGASPRRLPQRRRRGPCRSRGAPLARRPPGWPGCRPSACGSACTPARLASSTSTTSARTCTASSRSPMPPRAARWS